MAEPVGGDVAHGLVAAEERLRALGLTGGQAFDVLLDALTARRNGTEGELDPAIQDAVAPVPAGDHLPIAGLAYERFFPDLFKGRRGQYFTPPTVGRLLVEGLAIQPEETVLDPACGAGGLLQLAQARGAIVRGIERDPRLARLASVGLGGEVRCADMFTTAPEPVDVVVANPPFSVPVRDPRVLAAHDWPEERALSDQLFAALLGRWVRPGGRAGVVMPASVLANRSFATTRAVLDGAFVRTAVCLLPEGVFRPFGGAAGRAVILWLRRRTPEEGAPAPVRWARLADPGYDPRSQALKPTSEAEIDALIRGEGWGALPPGAWSPEGERLEGRRLGDVARVRRERGAGTGAMTRLDLGDVDPRTGEARPIPDTDLSGRQVLQPGDVLVSRLRPERGNVTVVPDGGPAVGSPEWVALEVVDAPRWVWLVARSPAWRAQLPVAAGQTRPRTTAEAVLDTRVPWPEGLVVRVDDLAARLLADRAELGRRLEALQGAVHAFVEDRDEVALEGVVDELDRD